MKRLFSMIVFFAIVLSLSAVFPANATEPATFSVSNGSGKPGDEVTVNVNIESNPGIISFLVEVGYDSNVLELKSSNTGDFNGLTFSQNLNVNPYSIMWEDSLNPNNTTNGTAAVLVFKIKEGAPAGDTAITVTYDPDNVFDSNYDNVYFETKNGVVTVSGDSFPDGAEITGANLLLGQDLSFKFTAEVDESLNFSEVAAKVSVEGIEGSKTIQCEDKGNGEFQFVFNKIQPQYMGRKVTAELYCDGILYDVYETSVKEYCMSLIGDGTLSETVRQLCAAVLSYGAAAQVYTDTDTDKLANSEVDPSLNPATVLADDSSAYTNTKIDMSYGLKIKSMGVQFGVTNKLIFRLTIPEALENVRLTVDGKDVDIYANEDKNDAVSDDIFAIEFDEMHLAELYVGDVKVQSLNYSVASYVLSQQNKTTDMANLAKALYTYGKLAQAYAAN